MTYHVESYQDCSGLTGIREPTAYYVYSFDKHGYMTVWRGPMRKARAFAYATKLNSEVQP